MSEFKFRVVDENEQQQQQDEIVDTIEGQADLIDNNIVGDVLIVEDTNEDVIVGDVKDEIDDQKVLNYLKDRYQKEYNTLDEVLTTKEKAELPDDIKKLMEFGVENYIKINKDWESVSQSELLTEYYKQTKPHLDADDISYMLEEEYSYDEDIDDDRDIKKKKVALKEELFKAKDYLNSLKDKYKVDLESKSADVPEDYKQAFSFYQEYKNKSEEDLNVAQKKALAFDEKTNNLFANDFKGFEFNLGDKKQLFKPSNVSETKEKQSNISNLISKHLDENGMLKDAHSYHKSLAMFDNPDAFAKFFYEQGKADATDNVIKNVKNIDMSVRDTKDVTMTNTGIKMRVINDDSFDNGMKVRSKRN